MIQCLDAPWAQSIIFAGTQAQQRLSSGKNVSSAIENPTNFFTAASLNNRAGDFGRLLDSIGEILAAGPHSPAVFF